MAKVNDRHNPSFVILQVNNNRTAWRPIQTPTILVVPHNDENNGGVSNVRVFIEDVPHIARVAGHQHIGLLSPDREIFAVSVNGLELSDKYLYLNDLTITHNGEEVSLEDAVDGDIISLTTSSGVTDTIEYIRGAAYYDLSDVLVEVETLPSDTYNLAYTANYYKRTVSTDGFDEFICVDPEVTVTALMRFQINHPGDIIENFFNLTTDVALDGNVKSRDRVLGLYRPLTDILQDIHDEQDILEKVNWVFDAPPEAIPYMSVLLGWDLPYFPQSLDNLRRAILRRTVEFQNIKGSRRAVINLFRLFGFEILISNLWWSADGKRLIRPGQILPLAYKDQEITIDTICETEAILGGEILSTAKEFTIPLLNRPQELTDTDEFQAMRDGGDITIDAYLVEDGSDVDLALADIISDTIANGSINANCDVNDSGYLDSDVLADIDTSAVIGYNRILISGKLGMPISSDTTGVVAPISETGISLNRETNTLTVTVGETLGYKLYAFATYHRQELVIPSIIQDLQSNRFDIKVIKEDLKSYADPVTLEFALELMQKVKAFHSLLNVILQTVELDEVYQVTDLCVGGNLSQRHDTDLGQLQVPPAIIPTIGTANECGLYDPADLGYKPSDLAYRARVINGLVAEFEAWSELDGREATIGGTKLPIDQPIGDSCQYNYRGQDRTTESESIEVDTQYVPTPTANQHSNSQVELSPIETVANGEFNGGGPEGSANSNASSYGKFAVEFPGSRSTHCELDNSDYCYKGRVHDGLLYQVINSNREVFWSKACSLGLGYGVYWTFPAYSAQLLKGVARPRGTTRRSMFSGSAKFGNIRQYLTDNQAEYLTASRNVKLPNKNNSQLGKLYQSYGAPIDFTIHYSNSVASGNQLHYLALQRPSLEITKSDLHFPGCRFPTLHALENDYICTDWDARPWDIDVCGPSFACGNSPTNYLNATLVEGEDGNETLVFDSESYSLLGNGLVADITTLGTHSLGSNFTADDVVHKVYMSGADSTHEAIELDGVCDYDGTAGDGFVNVDTPLFSSATDCGSSSIDYADGYPCESGYFTYGYDGTSDYDEVFEGLGVPEGVDADLLFRLNSGIRVGTGLRLDCGCLTIECDGTEITSSMCNTALFEDDWLPDRLECDVILLADETFGTCDIKLDGTIPSLLEVV